MHFLNSDADYIPSVNFLIEHSLIYVHACTDIYICALGICNSCSIDGSASPDIKSSEV